MFVYFNRLLFKSIFLFPFLHLITLLPFFPLLPFLSLLPFSPPSLLVRFPSSLPSFPFYPYFSYPSIPSNLSSSSYLLVPNSPLFSYRILLSLLASFPSNPLFLSYSSINPTPFFLLFHSFLPSIPSYPSFPSYAPFPSYLSIPSYHLAPAFFPTLPFIPIPPRSHHTPLCFAILPSLHQILFFLS